jgi:hypothetical protein
VACNGLVTGAYGLRIEGLGDEETLRVEGGHDWPPVHVRHAPGERSDAATELGDRQAVFQLLDCELRLDRERREATYICVRPLSVEEIVHPYLAPVANVFARWDGRESLHGGAFAAGGGAWALLGDKEAGKSTTLAWLASNGAEVMADDIVVLDSGNVMTGPRCLDVRDDVSKHLEAGSPASIPREGGRNRVKLPPLIGELPLRGFVYLEWGERTEVERITPAQRIERLQPQRQAARLHNDPLVQLDLAALPALVLRRRRGLEGLDEGAAALLEAVA